MSVFGFDPTGCIAVRVVSSVLEGSRRTHVSHATLEVEYADGTQVTVELDLEMDLEAFLALVSAINRRLRALHDRGG